MTPLECLTAELEPISAEFSKLTREKRMKISKRVVLTGLAGAATGLSTTAIAQTMSRSKSEHLGKLDEDEVMRVNPRTGTVQKSNIKISEARHRDAMATGAREIPPTAVIYKHSGKMYMYDYAAAANNQAAINFESQFDDD
jgi:hypothetical protein